MKSVDKFLYKTDYANDFLNKVFSILLICSKEILSNNKKLQNDENFIRNKLYIDYLKDNKQRKKLQIDINNINFEIETPEIYQYKEIGYVDFKVYNALNYFSNINAYFVIECKRLDGKSRLNNEYVNKGILRFVENKYPTITSVGGMFGFVVDNIDIDENVNKLNNIINRIIKKRTAMPITKTNLINNYNYYYISKHKYKTTSSNSFSLLHLMFDFSKIIN